MGKFEEETIAEKETPKKRKRKQKNITIHAVVPYDADFARWLESYNNGQYNTFEHKPLTFCATYEEAEEYCEQYFYLSNYCHFKMWCDCHEEEDINNPDSWEHYVEKVLLPDDDPNRQYLRICSFQFPISQVAALLRLSLNSLPVGLDNEEPEVIPEIMMEAISTRTPLPENYLQIFKGMREVYRDYEQEHNKTEKDFLVSEIIDEAINTYHERMEEIEDEEYGEGRVS